MTIPSSAATYKIGQAAAYLLDTNVLLRSAASDEAFHSIATSAVARLTSDGFRVCVCSAVLGEYWAVMTRLSTQRGGFGLTPERAGIDIDEMLNTFELLPDSPAVFTRWLEIVKTHSVSDVAAHDARIAAFASVYGIDHVLTFNQADFARYAAFTTAVHPAQALV